MFDKQKRKNDQTVVPPGGGTVEDNGPPRQEHLGRIESPPNSGCSIANLTAKYHDPVAVGIGSVLALWSVVALAIVGGRGLQRILPLRWIARLAALAMVVMAGFTLAEALR